MSNRRVKVGIVGLGRNGIAHARIHKKYGKSEIVALCDRDEEKLARYGQELGVSRLYSNESFFEDPHMEAVSINTGDIDHLKPFMLALKHGKHILVEKPLANTVEEVAMMVESVREADSNLKIQVGFILRWNPAFAEIFRLARTEKALGDIYYMESDYIHNLIYQKHQTDPATGHNWYLEDEYPMNGGGCHSIDLLRWFSGKEIVGVRGFSTHFAFPEMRHDDCQVALFRFEDGSIAKVASLYGVTCETLPMRNLRLYGTIGTIDGDQIAIGRYPQDEEKARFRPIGVEPTRSHPFDLEILDWLDAILENRPPLVDMIDGANSTMASLCACRALDENTTVEIPVFGKDI